MNIIEKLINERKVAGLQQHTRRAREWYLKRATAMSNVSQEQLLQNQRFQRRSKPLPGRMFMFWYDPKHKETLPFYDRFPLILMVGPARKGFYGLNLHYLDPRSRALFFDTLLKLRNNSKYDETTKLELSYNLLVSAGKFAAFQPCFKHYLFKQIVSATVEVPPVDWEVALFLPTDRFVYKNRRTIWKNSQKLIK